MQFITPIQNDERFLASGVYTHYQQGEPTGFYQRWTIHRQLDGTERARIHMDGRAADGRDILLEFVRRITDNVGFIDQCEVHAMGTAQDAVKAVQAAYQFEPDHVRIGRVIDGNPIPEERLDLPEGYVVRLASLLLTGYAVADMSMRNGKDVPVVAYSPQFKDEKAFSLHVYNQSAQFLKNDMITIDGKLLKSRLYKRWVSDNPETVFNVWLDDFEIPLKQADGDGYRRFTLTEYKRGIR